VFAHDTAVYPDKLAGDGEMSSGRLERSADIRPGHAGEPVRFRHLYGAGWHGLEHLGIRGERPANVREL